MSQNGGSYNNSSNNTKDKNHKRDVIQLNNMPGSTAAPGGTGNEDVDIADGTGVTRVRLASFETEDDLSNGTDPPPPPGGDPPPGGASGTSAPPPPPPETSSRQQNSRVINLNAPQREKFIGNRISTAKYSIWSFLPSFLFEQFRRYSNIFFLSIALLQQIPDVSPTGRYTTLVPLIFILTVSAFKEVIEDYKRHRADSEINNREVEVLKNGYWNWVKWRNVSVGDFVKIKNETFFPADLILYSSSEPQGLCYIETSNLDGETNLKVRQGLPETAGMLETTSLGALTGVLECELPNRHLYEFAGKLRLTDGRELALGPDQVLLRGAKLQNTHWVFGQVVYTGHETKLLKNSTAAPLKRSTIDKLTNTQIIMLFIMLILVAFISSVFSVILVDSDKLSYAGIVPSSEIGFWRKTLRFMYNVLTFVILYNNLIPISLTVTLEVVRFIQALFINWDEDMFYMESKTSAMARTSNLNEELGQVRYIFSDKTGTLTRNIMEFKGCSVAGKIYGPDVLFDDRNELAEDLLQGGENEADLRDFLILLSVCHTVIPDYNTDELVYHAASPDERALVYGAKRLGYAFETRTPSHVEIMAFDEKESYEILNVLEFTSTRKRMSVIVKAPDGKIRLYCKGADSVIYERLAPNPTASAESIRVRTQEHLEEFATQGLRTLCCAVTEILPEAYEDWKETYHRASTAIHNREVKLDEASNLIETNLRLLGATAIEDKLQEKVPETIASLMKAGISVWVLTGDKQETAINIGYSCRLLTQSMELLVINRDSLDATRECVTNYIHALSRDNSQTLPKESDAAVIIDGKTLKYALTCDIRHDFLQLCCSCRAVICCRASPIQKAEVVEYVTQHTGAVTLAIGDGANDVAMIQKAHVGVGISGVEGLQASCASDYSIAQFHFLTKLLFVHGAWNYDRMCKLIFYSYYKNICLYIVELWFAIYSAWSGQIIFERWTIGFYNMFFTCAQPIAMGIFDRHCSQEVRMRYPVLYRPNHDAFSLKLFFVWVGNSILHSMILFWVSMWLVGNGIVWGHGMEGGYLVLGNFIYTYVVIVVSLKCGLETKAWTVFTFMAIFGSILLWMVFLLGYSYVYTVLPLGAEICGIAGMVFSSPVFWVGLIVVPVATLLPDMIKKVFESTLFMALDEKFRQCEVLKKDPTSLLSQEKHSFIDDEDGDDDDGYAADSPNLIDLGDGLTSSASASSSCTVSTSADVVALDNRTGSRKRAPVQIVANVAQDLLDLFTPHPHLPNMHANTNTRTRSAPFIKLSETARLLRNVRNVFRRTTSDHVLDMELSHGYAFSQEEHGVVTQSQLIRSYDTTIPKPEGM